MSTRKIKDAKDLSTNELIYFKGHAQATYMSDGRTVEEAITSSTGGSGGTIDTSDCVKMLLVGDSAQPLVPDSDGVIDISPFVCCSITMNGRNDNRYKYTVMPGGNIDLGYINKQLVESTSSSMTLSPNIYYRNTSTSLSTLTITFASETSAFYNSLILNEYFVEFTTRSAGTTVTLPSGIKWMNGVTPTFEASTTYQISIVNNLGAWVKFK